MSRHDLYTNNPNNPNDPNNRNNPNHSTTQEVTMRLSIPLPRLISLVLSVLRRWDSWTPSPACPSAMHFCRDHGVRSEDLHVWDRLFPRDHRGERPTAERALRLELGRRGTTMLEFLKGPGGQPALPPSVGRTVPSSTEGAPLEPSVRGAPGTARRDPIREVAKVHPRRLKGEDRTNAERRAVLEAWDNFGDDPPPKKRFCREHDISVQTFNNWDRRFPRVNGRRRGPAY